MWLNRTEPLDVGFIWLINKKFKKEKLKKKNLKYVNILLSLFDDNNIKKGRKAREETEGRKIRLGAPGKVKGVKKI